MPELPEVERAASLIRQVAKGRLIRSVETTEDKIMYSGTNHRDFVWAQALTGRTISDVRRYGKVMYIELSGEGPLPVLHLGMTGMIQIRNGPRMYYRTKPPDETKWPPLYVKFILDVASDSSEDTQIAFTDPRRFGRIRLCSSPMTEPPISELGFDPILNMPPLSDFIPSVRKRSCAIKALLLDQSFSAGIGNWVADEVLYQARIHPEQRGNTLDTDQLTNLHTNIVQVCRLAVDVNADSSLFPKSWLFEHRWDKGKSNKAKNNGEVFTKPDRLLLPNGEPATIKWVTVGGRTSAYVVELQVLQAAAQAFEGVCAFMKSPTFRNANLQLQSSSESETTNQGLPSKRKRDKRSSAPVIRPRRVKK